LIKIPELPNLGELWCIDCTSLTDVPEFSTLHEFHSWNCPWIKNRNSSFESNVEKLKYLQRFCRNNLRYWIFRRWIKTREFAEWFYSPNQIGGRIAKNCLRKTIENI